MLTQLVLAYAASWLAALLGAAAVETRRLLTTGRLSPALDWTGALCLAWVSAPVAAPLWAGVRLWGWASKSPHP